MKTNKICHIADVQIRLYKRYDEFKYVFDQLNNSLKEKKPDIIVVCGDIVHSKISLSPECVKLTSDFFRMLSFHAPTHIILGNHDLVLSNKNRLDALTPIIENIDSNYGIHLHKKSGLVRVDVNLEMGVFSIIDQENYPIEFEKNKDKTYFAVYHGMLVGSTLDNNFIAKEADNTIDIFKNYDFAMLGDIHKRQNLSKTIAYSGSLLQNNYAEDVEKGYLLWDYEKLTSEFVNIKNKWGYYTFDLTVDKTIPDIETVEIPRIRMILKNPSISEIKELQTKIKEKYNPEEIIIKNAEDEEEKQEIISSIEDVNTLDNIEKLLTEFFNGKVKDNVLKRMLEINKVVFGQVSEDSIYKNTVWNLEKLFFSNMFSFGNDNEIDFKDYKGIIGLFASNRSGKSSVIDTILHTITGKNSKFKKNYDVINNRETSASCSVIISESENTYQIDRRLYKGDNKSSKTELNFQNLNDTSQNEKQKTDTEKVIRKMFGTFEDLTLTSFAIQGRITDFVERKTGESYRIKVFSKFLGLDIFDEMYKIVKKEMYELEVSLKTFSNVDFAQQAYDVNSSIKKLKEELYTNNNVVEFAEGVIKTLENNIIEIKSKIDTSVNVDSIEKNLDMLNSFSASLDSKIEKNKESLNQLNEKLKIVENEINNSLCDKEKFKLEIKLLEQKVEEYHDINLDIEIKQASLKKDNKNVDILRRQEWCDTTEICKNCSFYNDSVKIKNELDATEQDILALLEKSKDLNVISKLADIKSKSERYDSVTILQTRIKNDISKLNSDIEILNLKRNDTAKSISHSNSIKIKNEDNIKYSKELKDLSQKLLIAKNQLEKLNKESIDIKANLKSKESTLETLNNGIENLKKLELEYEAYSKYRDAISKDGIPYIILSKSVNFINHEINNILENFVNFKIKVETDNEDKDLAINLMYENGTFGPIEGASGMEKTISAIAIRAALTKISNIPKCNIFVLDEFASSLDSKYIGSIESMLNYLKNMFDIVLLITHQQEVMDSADKVITIKKENDYSKIIT